MFDTIIKRGNYFPLVGICVIPHSRILEFLRSGYFVVKLFRSRHYVYCFRFEMDMFWSLWLGRQYKKLLTDSQTPITPLSRPKTGAVHLTLCHSRGVTRPLAKGGQGNEDFSLACEGSERGSRGRSPLQGSRGQSPLAGVQGAEPPVGVQGAEPPAGVQGAEPPGGGPGGGAPGS